MAKQDSVHIRIGELESKENNGRTTTTTADRNSPRINQIAPTQVDGAAVSQNPPAARNFAGNVSKLLFFTHFIAHAILITFLSIRGFLYKNPTFPPAHYYIPFLTSSSLSAITSLLWLLFTLRHPTKAFKSSLWLSPSLTCFAGILLLADGTGSSLAFAALVLILAVVQALYACWITPRLQHAYRILSVSIPTVRISVAMGKCIVLVLAAAVIYSWFWTLGVGAIAAEDATRFDAIYVLMLLLSLAWTMQVIRNVVHVAVSVKAHAQIVRGVDIGAREAFQGSCGCALVDVCFGSAVAPVVGLVRGTARAMGLIVEDSDEFLFSCASCYLGVADRMVAYGNRWGFVHVGVHGKGFAKASEDTWQMFKQQRMTRLIDLDLTGAFCFLCGIAGGAVSALVGGSWMLAVDESYATGVTVYVFIIGYFMFRIAMSWPQACVSAYHVAYAEDPQNHRLGSTIPDRIRELQTSLV